MAHRCAGDRGYPRQESGVGPTRLEESRPGIVDPVARRAGGTGERRLTALVVWILEHDCQRSSLQKGGLARISPLLRNFVPVPFLPGCLGVLVEDSARLPGIGRRNICDKAIHSG